MRGSLVLTQLPPAPLAHLLCAHWLMALLESEEGTNDFAVVLVLEPHNNGHGDGRVSYEMLLDLEGVDVFATCVTVEISMGGDMLG